MVDISGNALAEAGFSIDNLAELREIGVTGLRMDYAIDNQQIAAFSKEMTISLNASTLTEKTFESCRRMEPIYSFGSLAQLLPRPETGLDVGWFQEKNRWLKAQGFFVQAFVPGMQETRTVISRITHTGKTPQLVAFCRSDRLIGNWLSRCCLHWRWHGF